MRKSFSAFRRVLAAAAILGSAGPMLACNTDRLLQVTDPDLINPSDVESADGAEAVRLGAMDRWVTTTAGPNSNGNESTWLFGGLLADEWSTASTFVQNDEADKRQISLDNGTVTNAFRSLNRVRTAVNQALPLMRKYRPTELTKLAELYLARSYAEMQLASDFCNGVPLSNAATAEGDIEFGNPLTVDSVFRVAITTADSGLATVAGTDTQSVNVRHALTVIKARALLGINQIAAAGALVATVPSTFSYNHTFSVATGDNGIWGQPASNRRYLVGDSLEGNARNLLVRNAIPFFSARDPRVPANYTISGTDTTKSQDGATNSRTTPLYGRTTPVAVASGLDARLIEAEARLAAGDPAWITTLNTLRATPRTVGTVTTPVMTPLADPGTPETRIDLLFREKAFWTFTRGHRLGDMRRLVRQYGRAPTAVFPEGDHYRGGTYGTDVNLPVPQQEENNPNFGGCIDRNA